MESKSCLKKNDKTVQEEGIFIHSVKYKNLLILGLMPLIPFLSYTAVTRWFTYQEIIAIYKTPFFLLSCKSKQLSPSCFYFFVFQSLHFSIQWIRHHFGTFATIICNSLPLRRSKYSNSRPKSKYCKCTQLSSSCFYFFVF